MRNPRDSLYWSVRKDKITENQYFIVFIELMYIMLLNSYSSYKLGMS